MTHATVFLILDAARADYCRPATMPFLSGLARRSMTGSFESPPGFAQRTVLFSGRHPDTSGNFSAFVFDPERSPFQWLRRAGPLRGLVRPRRVLFPTRLGVQGLTRWLTGAYHTDPAWIPPRFLPFFRPCEDMRPIYEPGALGAPSVFDLLRNEGRTSRYLAHPVSGDDEWIHNTLIKELREGRPYDLYVAQFSITDQKGHTDGPFSERMQRNHLPLLDERVAMVHAALDAGYDTFDLFVCGDHGMGPVQRRVNILAALKGVDARPAKDYVVFVNSTLAVFWYLTERGERAIEDLLPRIPGARPIDAEERRSRRIPLERRWGDRMLAADPGVLFWPDYFHVTDSEIVGMHGYLDKVEETHGLLVLHSTRAAVPPNDVGLRSLADAFPTLCDLLRLPTPTTNEGKSLLSREASAPAPTARTLLAHA